MMDESTMNYQEILESADDSFYIVDKEGRYLFINPHHRARLGIFDEPCANLIYRDLHKPEDSDNFLSLVHEVIETSEPVRDEYERDGIFFARTFSPVQKSSDGHIKAVMVISTDVTELKQIECKYRLLEMQYQILVETTNNSIYLVDRECRYLFMNSHHMKRLNISDDSYKNRSYEDYHQIEEIRQFSFFIGRVFVSREPLKEINNSGEHQYLRTFTPIKDNITGKIVSVIVISIDL